MRKLFVSYARENKRDVDQLVEHLGMMSYDTWVDEALRGGQDWWEQILQRIADSDAFIAIISHAALNSTACRREFDWAEALGKPVVPVALEPRPTALPSRLERRQIIDYSEPANRALAALKLQGGLATLPPAPPLPEPLPDPPAAPLSYLTDLVDLITQADPLDYQQQHQILIQLEPALRSTDPEERRGGRDIMEQFGSRREIYADVDRAINRLRSLADEPTPARSDSSIKQAISDSLTARPPDYVTAHLVAESDRDSTRPTTPQRVLGHVWKSRLISGGLTLALGALLLLATPVGMAVFVFFSAYLLVSGAAQVILAFAMSSSARLMLLISGAVSVVLAVSAIPVIRAAGHSDAGPLYLSIWLGLGFIIRGVAEAVSAGRERVLPGRSWHIVMGVITIVVAMVVLSFPRSSSSLFSSLLDLMRVTGFCLVILGVSEIVSSFGIRKAAGSARPAVG